MGTQILGDHTQTTEEGRLVAEDDVSLYYRAWRPDGASSAVLAVVHGYGEHGGRYGNLVEYFLSRGYTIYTVDLRGHGQSPGQRGHIQSFEEYLSDVRSFLRHVSSHEPEKPLFLLGHSMGGLIALRYAIEYPEGLIGVIASGPLLELAARAPAWKVWLGRSLSRFVPRLSMDNGLSAADLSHDPAVVAAYHSDPRNHHVVTARWFTEASAAMASTLAAAPRLRVPLLLMHGGDDRIAACYGSRRFFGGIVVEDRTYHEYDGFYHEIFNEIERERVFQDIETWLSDRLESVGEL